MGAATIVNAIPTGKGAAYGITLETDVEVQISDGNGGTNLLGPSEGYALVDGCLRRVLQMAGKAEAEARVRIVSDIPISRGLKSSSAVSNAVVMATARAAPVQLGDDEILRIGVDESLRAGVTVTGAFDDSAACFLGGVAITDNLERRIIKRGRIDGSLTVLVHIPEKRISKSSIKDLDLSDSRQEFEEAFSCALAGEYARAIEINSRACAKAFGLSEEVAQAARDAGAVAAGISGTGPATVVLLRRQDLSAMKNLLESKAEGSIVHAELNETPAREVVPRLL
jgi:shikimate kinase